MRRYDVLTDINLKLLNESNGKNMYESEFVNEEGNKIERWDVQTELLAEYMRSKGLITLNGEVCYITSFGEEVLENSGWLEHLKQKSLLKEEQKVKDKEKEERIEKIDKLTLNNLEYQETIKELKEELMISSLLKNYWYLIGGSIALGITIGGYLF